MEQPRPGWPKLLIYTAADQLAQVLPRSLIVAIGPLCAVTSPQQLLATIRGQS